MLELAILLPPSEQQNKHGNKFAPDVFDYRERTTFNQFHELIPERRRLIDTLHRAIDVDGEDTVAKALGGVRGVRLMKNVYSAELMAARRRYEAGALYAGLDFPRLPTGAQRRFLESSIIISGLFGLLRPDDLMPEYLLPVTATVPGLGPVKDYWRPVISPLLNKAVQDCMVWDLLSEEHRDVWDDGRTYKMYVRVKFYDRNESEVTDTLALRGKLAAHLVHQNKVTLETITSWKGKASQGYRFSERRSQLDEDMSVVLAMIRR